MTTTRLPTGIASCRPRCGADADEGVDADVGQFLQRNGGRGAADAGGADAEGDAAHLAAEAEELPVADGLLRAVEPRGDPLGPGRIAREEAVAGHGAGRDAQVSLRLLGHG